MPPPHHPRTSFFEQVVQIVKLIPHGRVTTYGAIAHCLGTRQSARMVGWALNHTHKLPEVPAHRVVNRKGMLTGKHHFEHIGSMQARLAAEGVVVKKRSGAGYAQSILGPSKRNHQGSDLVNSMISFFNSCISLSLATLINIPSSLV